jgi:hypothetical protein
MSLFDLPPSTAGAVFMFLFAIALAMVWAAWDKSREKKEDER